MTTLTTYLTNVRSNLDDTSSRVYTDAELTTWINAGVKQKEVDQG